jgi:D-sedoheptulose 7-phosphate isomerase/D-glycero-D-manno-heptose 1,7-bisphosphate phosphatase
MSIIQDSGTQAETADHNHIGPAFPARPYASASSYFEAYAASSAVAGSSIEPAALDKAAGILVDAYRLGATVFACGNGGSAAIANHLLCDHLKGVRTATDLVPRVVSLSTSIELITAIANDVDYAEIFTYQLQSQSAPGDVLVAVSSSGRSSNIVQALRWAREHDLRTIALTGFTGGDALGLADVSIHVSGANYGVVEDLHQAVMHVLAQYIRQSRMTPAAISETVF